MFGRVPWFPISIMCRSSSSRVCYTHFNIVLHVNPSPETAVLPKPSDRSTHAVDFPRRLVPPRPLSRYSECLLAAKHSYRTCMCTCKYVLCICLLCLSFCCYWCGLICCSLGGCLVVARLGVRGSGLLSVVCGSAGLSVCASSRTSTSTCACTCAACWRRCCGCDCDNGGTVRDVADGKEGQHRLTAAQEARGADAANVLLELRLALLHKVDGCVAKPLGGRQRRQRNAWVGSLQCLVQRCKALVALGHLPGAGIDLTPNCVRLFGEQGG